MIIDTETHVFYFTKPSRTNPSQSLVTHCTWHEHSADLLIAEMDRAGVDKSIVISYDAEDILWHLERNGLGLEDFSGGKKYTLKSIEPYRDRLIWFTTLKNPRTRDSLKILREDAALGAAGIKIFPSYIRFGLDEPEMLDVFRLCADLDLQVLIAFEDLEPPVTLSLGTYLGQLERVISEFPGVNFGLMHGGCADPLNANEVADFEKICRLTRDHRNLYLGTAKVGNLWDDGTEYPFARYQKRLEMFARKAGADRLMWATDWPWYDDRFIYEQGLNAIRRHAEYLTSAQKAEFLGGSAASFLKLG